MFEIERYKRDCVKINNHWFIVDTIKAPDTNKWETGISEVNLKKMYKALNYNSITDMLADPNFIVADYADDFADYWSIQPWKNKKEAIAGHAKICKTGEIKYEEEW